MSSTYQIALAGFDSFEYTTFESFFRLATKRDPSYAVCTDAALADLMVVNAENPQALQTAVAERVARPSLLMVLIGPESIGAAHGIPTVPRPVRFMSVLSLMDDLLSGVPTTTGFDEPLPSSEIHRGFAATEPFVPLDTPSSQNHGYRPTMPYVRQPTTDGFEPTTMSDLLPSEHGGFAATQPYSPLDGMDVPVTPPPVVRVAPPARQEDRITAESLKSYARQTPMPQPEPIPSPVAASFIPPARVAPPQAVDEPSEDGRAASKAVNALNALIVDDNEATIRFLRLRLDRLGFNIDTLGQSGGVVDAIAQKTYQMVFLDVTLNGFAICKQLKKHSTAQGLPMVVLVLRSRSGLLDKMRGRLAAADDFLAKPLTDANLKRVILRLRAKFPATQPHSV